MVVLLSAEEMTVHFVQTWYFTSLCLLGKSESSCKHTHRSYPERHHLLKCTEETKKALWILSADSWWLTSQLLTSVDVDIWPQSAWNFKQMFSSTSVSLKQFPNADSLSSIVTGELRIAAMMESYWKYPVGCGWGCKEGLDSWKSAWRSGHVQCVQITGEGSVWESEDVGQCHSTHQYPQWKPLFYALLGTSFWEYSWPCKSVI